MAVAGLLLAAGAGRRFGEPKALARVDGRPLVRAALDTLSRAGCAPVIVVLGARAEQVRSELPAGVHAVYAEGWESGMGASLRAGLTALAAERPLPEAALVHLVDLPDVPVQALRRVRELTSRHAVARACYDGTSGHPVLLGSRWWAEIASSVTGDRGARDWLRSREDLTMVECGDLATGTDVDTPEDLDPYARGCDGS